MTSTEYTLPASPLGPPDATIVRWLKRPGDRVAAGDPLLVVVNERVEVLFPAIADGVFEQALVAHGEPARAGSPVAVIAAATAPPAEPAAPESARARPETAERRNPTGSDHPRRISPVARRIAGDTGVDITKLRGSGPSGRLMKADILAARAARSPKILHQEGAVARYGKPSVAAIPGDGPYALTAMEVDMGSVAAARARLQADQVRRSLALTDTACVALAVVEALLAHPLLNSMWAGERLIVRRRLHLGVVDRGGALAVVRDAQDLNARGLARAIGSARANGSGDPSACTFTIADLGDLWLGTPPIGPSQSAALGVGAVRPRPIVVSDGGADRVAVRPVALLALAYDARAFDHYHADAFLRDVKRALEQFRA